MRYRPLLAGALGILALALGLSYTFAPETVAQLPALPAVQNVIRDVPPSRLLTGIGGVLSLYALAAAWFGGGNTTPTTASTESRYAAIQQQPPEDVGNDERTPITAISNTDLDADRLSKAATTDAQSILQETAYATLTTTAKDPEHALTTGAWTDNQLAAAFLVEDTAVDYPLWSRLRLWLDPSRERARRVRETTRAVTNLADDLTEADTE